MLRLWQRHAPNLANAVIDLLHALCRSTPSARCRTCARGTCWSARSPTDKLARTARSRARANYRAHIPGLYLCGSSSHPGGNITGLPAYNAAQVILADLGIKADWVPTPIARQLAAVG